jgi:hypothetical protein
MININPNLNLNTAGAAPSWGAYSQAQAAVPNYFSSPQAAVMQPLNTAYGMSGNGAASQQAALLENPLESALAQAFDNLGQCIAQTLTQLVSEVLNRVSAAFSGLFGGSSAPVTGAGTMSSNSTSAGAEQQVGQASLGGAALNNSSVENFLNPVFDGLGQVRQWLDSGLSFGNKAVSFIDKLSENKSSIMSTIGGVCGFVTGLF